MAIALVYSTDGVFLRWRSERSGEREVAEYVITNGRVISERC